MTPQQKQALQMIDATLQPSRLAVLLQQGTRQDWCAVNGWMETLRPLMEDEAPPAPQVEESPNSP